MRFVENSQEYLGVENSGNKTKCYWQLVPIIGENNWSVGGSVDIISLTNEKNKLRDTKKKMGL